MTGTHSCEALENNEDYLVVALSPHQCGNYRHKDGQPLWSFDPCLDP